MFRVENRLMSWIMGKSKARLLKGSSTKNFLSAKSHILGSNGVWYSSFWSEGTKNHLSPHAGLEVGRAAPRGTWGQILRPQFPSLGYF